MQNYLNIIGQYVLGLFLKAQGYPPAVIFSVILHMLVIYLMLDHDFAPKDMVDLDKPIYVSAISVNENPQRKMRVLNEQRQQAEREAQAERERQQAEQQRIEDQRQREEAAREEAAREEAARRQRERVEQAEQERLAELQRQEEERLAEERRLREQQEDEERRRQDEAAREAQARREAEILMEQQAAQEADAVNAYVSVIHNAISNNWVRPPSARNGMTVVINLQLLPTGEIRSYEIIQSSGDAVFDRSAEQAVAKAGRFPELQEMPTRLFNSQFRNINLTFRPEDLLR